MALPQCDALHDMNGFKAAWQLPYRNVPVSQVTSRSILPVARPYIVLHGLDICYEQQER